MATNRRLDTRVEKLERVAGIGENSLVLIADFVSAKDDKGELVGVTVDGKFVERAKVGSERTFFDRVIAEHRRPGRNALVLIAKRQWPDGTT
jgi:hypothetical protein